MKKVAFVHGNSNIIAGQEKVLINIVKGIKLREYEVVVILPKEGIFADELKNNGIRVKFSALSRFRIKNPLPFIMTVLKLYAFIKKEKIAVIHTSGLYPNQYSILSAKLAGIPCVCHLNSTIYNREEFAESLLGLSDSVIAVSNGVKENIQRSGVLTKEIKVIYNGFESGQYHANPDKVEKIKKDLCVSGKTRIIGQIGRITERKGMIHFIKVAKIVSEYHEDVKFLLIGDDKCEPGYMDKMKDLVRELGLTGRVVFTGYQDDIAEWISLLDIAVHCSEVEGLPSVLIEAMLLNKPVICTAIPGSVEIVENGRTGLLVPVGGFKEMADSVLQLLRDNEYTKNLVNNAKQMVETKFDLNKQIDQILDVYNLV